MAGKPPTQNHMREYIRTALKKGCLTDEEHSQIAQWLPLHPGYPTALGALQTRETQPARRIRGVRIRRRTALAD